MEQQCRGPRGGRARQGLTLVHFPAQGGRLRHDVHLKCPSITPDTFWRPPEQFLNAPPIPWKAITLSR